MVDEEEVDPSQRAMFMAASLQIYVGKQHVVKFLTSERGKALNGRMCNVLGHDGERLSVRMQDDGTTFNLKMCNLLNVAPGGSAGYVPASGKLVPDDEIVRRLKEVLQQVVAEGLDSDQQDRRDTAERMAFMQLHAGQVPPASRCMDAMHPESEMKGLPKFLNDIKPCCHGDGLVDFRRFNTGLVGGGGECTICLEKVPQEEGALGFPCGHIFHSKCASAWLADHNTCPSCRFKLGMPGNEYKLMLGDYEERLTVRLKEWFISGMCERCQSAYQEADPLCAVHDDVTGISTLVPRSRLSAS